MKQKVEKFREIDAHITHADLTSHELKRAIPPRLPKWAVIHFQLQRITMLYPRYHCDTTAPLDGLEFERRLVERPGLVQNTNASLPEAGKMMNLIKENAKIMLDINLRLQKASVFQNLTYLYF